MPAGGPSTFHLVRHGETDALGRDLTGRRPGTALNEQGRRSAERRARAFAGVHPNALLCSPQLRAQETASFIAAVLDTIPVEEPALDEVDFGAWSGQPFSLLDSKSDWQNWNALRSLAPAPGGETMLQAQARAVGLLQKLHGAAPGGEYILVTHADIIKSILSHLLGSPIDLMQRIDISPASVSSILLHDRDVRVLCINA